MELALRLHGIKSLALEMDSAMATGARSPFLQDRLSSARYSWP